MMLVKKTDFLTFVESALEKAFMLSAVNHSKNWYFKSEKKHLFKVLYLCSYGSRETFCDA